MPAVCSFPNCDYMGQCFSISQISDCGCGTVSFQCCSLSRVFISWLWGSPAGALRMPEEEGSLRPSGDRRGGGVPGASSACCLLDGDLVEGSCG